MARGRPCLPNLLIIGAAKAGTTSLHNYLSEHPDIFMSKHKELNFFNPERRWHLGVEWYKSNFDDRFAVNGEASPKYSRYPRTLGVPDRIRDVLGTPKLVYIIRDPIDRLLAQYTEVLADFERIRPFRDVMADIENAEAGYIQLSSYHLQLEQYLRVFPRDAIHVMVLERLKSDPRRELRNLFRFIGVNEEFWSPKFDLRSNVGASKRITAGWFRRIAPSALRRELSNGEWLPWKLNQALDTLARVGGAPVRKPSLSQEDNDRLQKILRPDIVSLRALLGDPLSEWRPYEQ
jgi:hypothetical protein